MERKKVQEDKQRVEQLQKTAKKDSGLAGALADRACYRYTNGTWEKLWEQLTGLYGKQPNAVRTVEEFWHPKLAKAAAALAGEKLAQEVPGILSMAMEGQFSGSIWRHSFRSSDFGYYAARLTDLVCSLIKASCITETVQELLFCNHEYISGYKYMLAWEIRRGNAEVVSLVREAILGENAEVLLTRAMIEAVILSGNEELVELLLKLLLAARLQEGVRQQILESADVGSIDILIRILKLCIEEKLFRYSSAARAFCTWTGLGEGIDQPRRLNQCVQYAYDCLTDPKVRESYFKDGDNQKAYFALWAMGCYEMADTERMTAELLQDEKPYRRVLGWLFVQHSNSDRYMLYFAGKNLGERNEELLAWIVTCLPITWGVLSSYYNGKGWDHKPVPNAVFPENIKERKKIFTELKEAAAFIGNRTRTFTGNPFEWNVVVLEKTRVVSCMMSLAGYDMDSDLVAQLLPMQEWMNADQRKAMIIHFIEPEKKKEHRIWLREMLRDRSSQVKELAVKRLSDCKLDQEDYEVLAESLRSKSSSLRKAVLSVFQKQNVKKLSGVLPMMLESTEEFQNQAAAELLLDIKEKNPEILEEYSAQVEKLRQRQISSQTKILLDQLTAKKEEKQEYTAENGFGLYDPAVSRALVTNTAPEQLKKKGLLNKLLSRKEDCGILSQKEMKSRLPVWEDIDSILEKMNQVFERHADYEYTVTDWNGSRQKILFGDPTRTIRLPVEAKAADMRALNARVEMVPFYEEFLEALGDYASDPVKAAGLCFVTAQHYVYMNDTYMEISPWFAPIEKAGLSNSWHKAGEEKYGNRYWQMISFIGKLPQRLESRRMFAEMFCMYCSMVAFIGEENLGKSYIRQIPGKEVPYYLTARENPVIDHRMLAVWRMLIQRLELSPEDFREWFLMEYRLERLYGKNVSNALLMKDYFRACDEGVIPKDILFEFLISGQSHYPRDISLLTNPGRYPEGRTLFEQYPWADGVAKELTERILFIEEKRGELPTPLTAHAMSIERFEGAEHFCRLLAALGKENFFRGYDYASGRTKQTVLSRLLKRCYPSREDTSGRLKALLAETDIRENRLVEAVMYAPQWAGFAEEILGWPGLKCGVWFFHAHINETFSAEKETETAIYSPISPKQFNDGAFDKNWFFEAYEKLGEKRFGLLYKSAKYITSGGNQHRRSQLYADAVLGKLRAEDLKKEITEKRNQEKLRCYPLIPIQEGDRQEALRRYEFIRKFQKESRQFGSQRRESERKACATAMENLAITTGLLDVNRLIWQMESAKMEEIRPFMQPVDLGGVTVALVIDAGGDAGIAVEKNGKALKSVPKQFNKQETVVTLKELVKELKEQKRRGRESLEKAMMEAVSFGAEELINIAGNPVLSPMLFNLVWTDEKQNGFLQVQEGRLTLKLLGGEVKIPDGEQLRIAHPHDLRMSGEWAGYMHSLYTEKRTQPFKQVFREYYPMTEDERQEGMISRRYAGYQVQPKQTVALLKGRGWTVDYEEGLQKVFYRENLIVRMYALADWFSPADMEAPTLETVQFFDRNTGKPVEMEKVPPILFSETMRDIDLVVSVAHVGGVDPEASHSTVEMRVAIAKELAALLRLSNVSWVGSHAKIEGKLANYSVHMGSGVVHAEGVGMIAILPVHSQARGRIFLPFADDDPKTAEIMSKILLLAEDRKIRDPAILEQICG